MSISTGNIVRHLVGTICFIPILSDLLGLSYNSNARQDSKPKIICQVAF
ncbi:hypothetical protein [Arsukibacterium sp.]|nr:hypothetical protein [Arsukibacterium sp.]